MTLPEDLRPCVIGSAGDLEDDALEWNLGRSRARDALDGAVAPDTFVSCPSELSGR
jgi:hypothetical protein